MPSEWWRRRREALVDLIQLDRGRRTGRVARRSSLDKCVRAPLARPYTVRPRVSVNTTTSALALALDVAVTGLRHRVDRLLCWFYADRSMATTANIRRLLLLAVVIDHLLVVVVGTDLPRVLSQPGRRFLARGMPARLDCPADANPPVTDVRWAKNGRPLAASDPDSSPWRLKVTERGALVFRSVSPDDAGRYSCTPYSQLGEGRSSVPVQLIVKGQLF